MFREIRTTERITEEDRIRLEEENRKNREYLKIHPETKITVKEFETFWNSMFQG